MSNYLAQHRQPDSSNVILPEQEAQKQIACLFTHTPLTLDCGLELTNVQVAYHTYGEYSSSANLVLHALTGDSAVHEWWGCLLGKDKPLDPSKDYIVCSNVLGGCSGTTSALELGDAPISMRDMVRVGRALLEHLGISKVRIVGSSMGGMLAYAWLLEYPELIEKAVIIGAPARHSPWAIGLNFAGRNAIKPAPNGEGLKIARQIAMLSYRSPESFAITQSGERTSGTPAIASYLNYQGEKLLARFCEKTYLSITQAMDNFQPSDYELSQINAPVLCIGISSDMLYTASEVKYFSELMPNGVYWQLNSIHGHDAFLIDQQAMPEQIKAFLDY